MADRSLTEDISHSLIDFVKLLIFRNSLRLCFLSFLKKSYITKARRRTSNNFLRLCIFEESSPFGSLNGIRRSAFRTLYLSVMPICSHWPLCLIFVLFNSTSCPPGYRLVLSVAPLGPFSLQLLKYLHSSASIFVPDFKMDRFRPCFPFFLQSLHIHSPIQ